MEQRFTRLARPLQGGWDRRAAALFRRLSRFPDVIIAPWLLEASMLYLYLLARLVSLSLPMALGLLNSKAMPHLKGMADAQTANVLQAAAARINLGYLMICGAMALIVLSTGPYLASIASVQGADWDETLMWLIVGQSSPVIFGATGLLMHVMDRGNFYDLLQGLTAALFFSGVFLFEMTGPVAIAQTLAVAQLTLAAICALLLTQSGIWPGFTALFQREIKLF